MCRWTTDLGVLGPGHRSACLLHVLALDANDRYQRFGLPMSDERVMAWAQQVRLDHGLWLGAWGPGDTGLLGLLQLAPTGTDAVHELALTVLPAARRQGMGTALLATALEGAHRPPPTTLVCEHGHPAMVAMARRLGLSILPDAHPGRLRMVRAGLAPAQALVQPLDQAACKRRV